MLGSSFVAVLVVDGQFTLGRFGFEAVSYFPFYFPLGLFEAISGSPE